MGKMASFFAGLGGGYLKADRQRSEDERQAKKDGQDTELFNARMDEINQAKKLNSDLSTASKPATFSENTPTLDTGDGARVYGMQGGADVAASDARQFRRMMPEAPAPTQGQAFAVNGTAVPDRATMQSTVNAYDEGANERIAQAYRANGKPLEAINMSNAVMENKAKSLGLETAQLKFANDKFNNDVVQKINNHTDWTKGLAQILTETQVGRLKGVSVNPLVSSDGKMVSFVADGPDGPGQPLATFPNTEQGKKQAMQMLQKAPIETQIAYITEREQAARGEAKDDRDERRVATGEKLAGIQEKKTDGMLMGLIGGGRGGSARAGANPTGLAMDAVYKRLEAEFTTVDPETKRGTVDTASMATVRNLIAKMPAAQAGDVDGAYLQAMQVYQKAQAIGGGDPAKTQQALAQMMGGATGATPAALSPADQARAHYAEQEAKKAAAVARMRGQAAPTPSTKAEPISRQITTIVPPRSAADMKTKTPKTPETDNELAIRYMSSGR